MRTPHIQTCNDKLAICYLHRLFPGKTEVRIYDYVDHAVPMLMKMFKKRLRGYRVIGYARDETALGLQEDAEDAVVEYDSEVLRNPEGKNLWRAARRSQDQDAAIGIEDIRRPQPANHRGLGSGL